MNKEKNFISAVIYVHNAGKRIGVFLEFLIVFLEENFEHSEIICVNDFSKDNSTEEIKRVSIQAKNTAVSILNMSYFHGMEAAMNAGADLAIGDFMLEIDLVSEEYSMEDIQKVYKQVLAGFDIVSASADRKQKVSSALFYRLYERFTAERVKMQTESFRILSRRAINRVGSMSSTIPYRKGLYENCGLKTYHMIYKPRHAAKQGKNKNDDRYRTELAIDSLLMFTDMGYFCAKTLTMMLLLISLFMIAYTVVVYVTKNPVAGWTTTILFMAAAFCGLFAVLTIIVKYLQILLNLSFRRKKYSFESIEKLTR